MAAGTKLPKYRVVPSQVCDYRQQCEALRDLLSSLHYPTHVCIACESVGHEDNNWSRCANCEEFICVNCAESVLTDTDDHVALLCGECDPASALADEEADTKANARADARADPGPAAADPPTAGAAPASITVEAFPGKKDELLGSRDDSL